MALNLAERMSYFVSQELVQYGSDSLLELRDKKGVLALIYRQPLRKNSYLLATVNGYFIIDFSNQKEESHQDKKENNQPQPISLDVLKRLVEGDAYGLMCQLDYDLENKQTPILTSMRIEHEGQEYLWVQGDAGMEVEAVDLVHPSVAMFRAKMFWNWARGY